MISIYNIQDNKLMNEILISSFHNNNKAEEKPELG